MFWRVFFAVLMATESILAISVRCPTKRYTVILFQRVNLICEYSTSATQPPIVIWKYKSYCRNPLQAALNPSSAENILSQNNPNYDPNIECGDSERTVRIVASKHGDSVTLGEQYQNRKISVANKADLNIAETAWGDSGVYYCTVSSAQDLKGNGECYSEVLVLERKSNTTDLLPGIDLLVMEDWLLVVLVVLGFFLLLLLIGICWCQCCPHTCCCYVSCPCCPERCCCPRALYEAGKAVKKGMPNQYATPMFSPSLYAQPMYGGSQGNQPAFPMLPVPNGGGPPPNSYGRDYDVASSVGQGSQVPLLQDGGGDHTRSGYRIQVDPDGNATRAIYYMEKELASLDPSRPANYNRLENMSTVSSLHDSVEPRGRGGRPPMPTVYDQDEAMSTISSVSQQGRRRDDYPRHGGGPMANRGRARSMDNLDDIGRRYRDDYPPHRGPDEPRGRRGSDEWSSSARSGYDRNNDDRRRRDYSPEDRRRGGGAQSGLAGRRCHSRDDIMEMERDRRYDGGARGGREDYDDSFLREALERKRLGEQQRARSRERLDSESDRSDRGRGPRGPPPLPMSPPSGYPDRRDNYPPPQPPPYSDDESVSSSRKTNLRKNGAVSRESLVV
ncbi:lipolysis-stimulated lipoprotein receptor isoform X1 [Cyprinodon tularosa]|uniref:lipolysis-stimulated lipoprotein receptor isoform X1 n=1 Tax=Cyprinodon tularosa TaxID=77115 RepID=UPI0018E27F15|nr:lipolysis-stimulated lipoprotein receptor isoform X1 [Cyprinodon tularosa]